MVLTGRNKSDVKKGLYIQICRGINMSEFTCTMYRLQHQGAQQYTAIDKSPVPSPQIVLQELGWFSDPAIFETVIPKIPIPTVAVTAQQHDEESLEDKILWAWINDVLKELAQPQHADRWQRNTGNSI
jgi:hypothetical protein